MIGAFEYGVRTSGAEGPVTPLTAVPAPLAFAFLAPCIGSSTDIPSHASAGRLALTLADGNLLLTRADGPGLGRIELIGANGSVIAGFTSMSDRATYPIAGLAPGLYAVKACGETLRFAIAGR
jgi:hypothetical protein